MQDSVNATGDDNHWESPTKENTGHWRCWRPCTPDEGNREWWPCPQLSQTNAKHIIFKLTKARDKEKYWRRNPFSLLLRYPWLQQFNCSTLYCNYLGLCSSFLIDYKLFKRKNWKWKWSCSVVSDSLQRTTLLISAFFKTSLAIEQYK